MSRIKTRIATATATEAAPLSGDQKRKADAAAADAAQAQAEALLDVLDSVSDDRTLNSIEKAFMTGVCKTLDRADFRRNFGAGGSSASRTAAAAAELLKNAGAEALAGLQDRLNERLAASVALLTAAGAPADGVLSRQVCKRGHRTISVGDLVEGVIGQSTSAAEKLDTARLARREAREAAKK